MSRIAIIGLAGRFPGARSVEEFWHLLRTGGCALETLSFQELRRSGVPSDDLANPRYVRSTAPLAGHDAFDAERFGYSPREAKILDPQQRVFLEICLTALEDAGVGSTGGARVAVFAGAGGNVRSYASALSVHGETASLAHVSTDKDFLATRASFELGLVGPSLSVQTSTSSSLVAVHLACRSLLDEECDVALAGGVSIRFPHRVGYLFEEGGVLSADGICRPLDAGANGTVFGSGAGVVVLKRLDDALADHDRVRAVVLGSAVAHDGGEKDSYVISSSEGVARVQRQALARAGVEPQSIGLVEAHATGTVMGDPIEFAGLSEVYGRGRTKRTGIGSVKGNVGHLEAAAGIASLIKTVLSLENRLKPKTLGVKKPNPALTVEESPFRILENAEPWLGGETARRAAVSSLGLGGTNAAVILEEAPAQAPVETTVERPFHLLTLSAASEEALARQAKIVSSDLRQHSERPLGDACYTANVGRSPLAHRLAVAASSARTMADALDRAPLSTGGGDPESAVLVSSSPTKNPPVVAFLFSGQGQQRLGMTRQLFETLPSFRASLLACDALTRKRADWSIVDILYGSDDTIFQRPRYLQPIFFSVQYSLAKILLDWGVVPSFALGHSLGEYAAACTAEAFSLSDAIDLVVWRGRLVDQPKGEPLMVSAFASGDRVHRAVAPFASTVAIAAQNSADEWVLAGEARDVRAIARELELEGIRVRQFDIGFAAHSPALDGVLDDMETAAKAVDYRRDLRFPIVSTLTGRLAQEGDLRSAGYWRRHLRNRVRAASATEHLCDLGANVFLEIGPSPTFVSAAASMATARGTKDVIGLPLLSRKEPDWRRLLETLGTLFVRGVNIHWKAFDRDFQRRKVPFPTYAFNRQTFNLTTEQDAERRGPRNATSSLHSLGQRIHSPVVREHIYEREVHEGGQEIFGLSFASLRFFLEIALAGANGREGRSLIVSDVTFLEPLIFQTGSRRLVQTIVRATETRPRLEVFSAMSADDEWTLHCKLAFAETNSPVGTPSIDVASAQAAASVQRDGAALYRSLDEHGFRIPEKERLVTRLWSSGGSGVVELSDRIFSITPFSRIPAALDAAAQALLATVDWEEDRTWLPLGFQSLEVDSAAATECHGPWVATIEIPDVLSDRRTVTADIALADRSGRRMARLSGYCLRAVDRSILVAQGRELSEWSYEVAWEVQESKAESSQAPPPLRPELSAWVVVGEGSFATEVCARLKASGGRVRLVDDVGKLAVDTLCASHGVINLLPATLTANDPLHVALRKGAKSILDIVDALALGGALTGTASPSVIVVTRGGQPVLGSLMEPNQTFAWGLTRTLKGEHPNLRCMNVDLDPHAPDHGLAGLMKTLVMNGETQIAFRHGRRHVPRLVRSAPSRRRLTLPSDRFRATLQSAGQFDNVVLTPAPRETPAPHQVEIAARAHGLSFRDVLTVLGVPGAQRGEGIGFECAGVVASVGANVSRIAVGDSVMALSATHLASNVIVDERLVAPIPAELSFEEAASIPLAFTVAWHLVHDVARIRTGQTVLVHAAAGAIGQALVQVAREAGARVFATASVTKQHALRALRIERVFSSRTHDFGVEVVASTAGAGVDVVFHSLQPRFLETSVQCLKENGTLVDLSVGAESTAGVAGLGRRYHRFDLITAIERNPERLGEILERVAASFAAGTLRPVPSTAFAINDVATAFRRLVSPKHSGKVVVTLAGQPISSVSPRGEALDPLGTYVVSGGAASDREALGTQLRVAGAGRVLRIGAASPFEAESAHDDDIRVDTADSERLVETISTTLKRHSPIRGIFLLSRFAPPVTAEVMDWSALSAPVLAEGTFARAVDQATRNLPLDFFFFFSSIASSIGIPGAAFESILASYLDGLAHSRRASGLTGTTINWGVPAFDDATAAGPAHWARGRLGILAPARALNVIASMLADPPPQSAILAIRWESIARQQPALRGQPFLSRLFLESTDPRRRKQDIGRIASELRDAPASERLPRLTEFVEASIVRVLGLRASQRLDPRLGFRELGLDSLLAVELRNQLQEALDIRLAQGITFNHPNLTSLAEFLGTKLFPTAAPPSVVVDTPPEDDEDLESMSGAELERLMRAELAGD